MPTDRGQTARRLTPRGRGDYMRTYKKPTAKKVELGAVLSLVA